MGRKIILDVDPGVPDALALCMALYDPRLEVAAVTATGGNVNALQATLNVQALVEQFDPPRWPRVGAASADQLLATDGREFWGDDGLCGADIRVAELHNPHPAVKLITDAIKSAPGEVTLVACGPLSNVAAALQREPDLANQIGHLFIVGGTYAGPGNVTATAEFNIFCDAEAARAVFLAPVTKTLLPLDVSSRVVLRYDLLDSLPPPESRVGKILRAILPAAFMMSHQRLGVEGLLAPEAVAIVGILHPEFLTTERRYCDVELNGELTRGTTVIDRRPVSPHGPNTDVVVDINTEAVLECIVRALHKSRPSA